jgi:thymidylate kinase
MQIIDSRLISIEGNIGAGKTTLLREIKKRYESDPRIVFIDEPVEEEYNPK